MTLKLRVMRAGVWSLGAYGLTQVIRLGSNLIMTRLLAPEMFGVMAIANLLYVGLTLISDIGIRQSVIYSPRGNDAAFLNTAWIIQIGFGLLICVMTLGAAGALLALQKFGIVSRPSVYAEPVLPAVIAVLSVNGVINGFTTTKIYEANRVLALGRVVGIEVLTQIAGLASMIIWVQIDRSVWALVAGAVGASLFSVVLGHLWMPGRGNRWSYEASAASDIFHFGKWVLLSSILSFFVGHGDRLLLGGLISVELLGVYVIAYFIFAAVEQAFQRIVGEVGFSAFSEVARERRDNFVNAYYRLYELVAVGAYFAAGALIACGSAAIELLYDKRYSDAGWMLQILAVALIAIPQRVNTQALVALGKPQFLTLITLTRLATLVPLTIGGFYLFGAAGAIIGNVLSYFTNLPLNLFLSQRFGFLRVRRELLLLIFIPIGLAAGKVFEIVIRYITP